MIQQVRRCADELRRRIERALAGPGARGVGATQAIAVAGAGGDAPGAIVERLVQVDRELVDLAAREQALRAEQEGIDRAGFREDDPLMAAIEGTP